MSTAHIFDRRPTGTDRIDETPWSHQLGLWRGLCGLYTRTTLATHTLCIERGVGSLGVIIDCVC